MPAAALLTISLTPELLAVVLAALFLAVMAAIGSCEIGDDRRPSVEAGQRDGTGLSRG